MIEDTILMMAIGADITGILILRTIFSIIIVGIMMRLSKAIPDKIFYRWLFVNT